METNLGQVVLVKDINPGTSGSSAGNLTAFEDRLYFVADDGVNGEELWVSDGTTEGTTLLKDINPGTANGFSDSYVSRELIVFGDRLYFLADDGENGE